MFFAFVKGNCGNFFAGGRLFVAGSTLPPLYPAGACPAGRRLTLPLWCPPGGLPFSSPAYPAFSFISCPIPPTPFPHGEGGGQSFLMQGAKPLASPGLNPRGTGSTCRCGTRGGLALFAACQPCQSGIRRGACLSPRPPTPPLALFLPPSPRPLPPRGRGCPKVYFAGGFAPGTPA